MFDPLGKLPGRLAERSFWLDLEVASELRHRKQQVAELFLDLRRITAPGGLLELAELLIDLLTDGGGAVPVEPDAAHRLAEASGPLKRGRRDGATGDDAARLVAFSPLDPPTA